jgi:hypothetical protein
MDEIVSVSSAMIAWRFHPLIALGAWVWTSLGLHVTSH